MKTALLHYAEAQRRAELVREARAPQGYTTLRRTVSLDDVEQPTPPRPRLWRPGYVSRSAA
jgi:hypothetical protein